MGDAGPRGLPRVFWAHVLEAFRRRLLLPDGGAGLPRAGDSAGRALLVRFAAALEGLAEPVVLVVDGLDKAPGREVAAGLEFLVDHAGPGLRLLLTSRVDPLLPLHRYRAEGRLCELRGAELAFTPREAAALLRGHGLAPGGRSSPGSPAAPRAGPPACGCVPWPSSGPVTRPASPRRTSPPSRRSPTICWPRSSTRSPRRPRSCWRAPASWTGCTLNSPTH
ncbi:hypothetical protein PQR15_03510 [Streptomyces lydicus]|nr:hypothetical protein [Streptomyces lydicus]